MCWDPFREGHIRELDRVQKKLVANSSITMKYYTVVSDGVHNAVRFINVFQLHLVEMKIVQFHLVFLAERINCSQTVSFVQRELQLHETGAKESVLGFRFKQLYCVQLCVVLLFPIIPSPNPV